MPLVSLYMVYNFINYGMYWQGMAVLTWAPANIPVGSPSQSKLFSNTMLPLKKMRMISLNIPQMT